ncbi:DNA-binding protein WhiA [Mechercharimyces sp. CAU 1602]|uniref:DNA-binding protein WhiA n=1 Tax=Mechercharimyces sp. CAU 1602 TaxID=2973933 RepID=UPI002162D62A|nr:DNA-binding protein WhiA [Mechercharimyces sp. CAU 1602]MCS1352199.1 DNA-binding protein WhiA [Mechercharimyces sp. CAU 1602]
MSFTGRMKNELSRIDVKPSSARAELSAIVRIVGSLSIYDKRPVLDLHTENASIARRIFSLFKLLYAVQPEVMVRKKARLKKNNVYIIRVLDKTESILEHLCIMRVGLHRIEGISSELIGEEYCRRSYLRGAFLAGGSVNNPDSGSYHLEIISTYHDHAEHLCELLQKYHLHAKLIERKKGYVVYLKEADKIGELLNLMGAHQSLLHFEDVRIMKDMRNSVNRLVNCETANLNKTIQASMRQVENIRLIEAEMGLEELPERLREVAEARIRYPDVSLTELGQLLPGEVSKSAVNHRLRKINELAHRIRKMSGEDETS